MPLPKSFKLSSGYHIPSIGFGTWDAVEATRSGLYDATLYALKCGYRSIDTAWSYGTEKPVGEAILKSGIPRQELFITTKVCNHMHKHVKKSAEMSLDNLQTDYLDLLLLHWPIAFKAESDGVTIATHPSGKPILDEERSNDHSETWKDMEALVASGKVRSIGVSNFNISQLQKLLKTAKIPPAVNQIEIHPWLTQPELHQFCKENNIILMAYSPLGGQHPDGHRIHGAQKPLNDETIVKIAEDLHKDRAQVILSWLVQRGNVVIPKSGTISRIRTNFDLFELDDEDFDAIQNISKKHGQKRFCNLDPLWDSNQFANDKL